MHGEQTCPAQLDGYYPFQIAIKRAIRSKRKKEHVCYCVCFSKIKLKHTTYVLEKRVYCIEIYTFLKSTEIHAFQEVLLKCK